MRTESAGIHAGKNTVKPGDAPIILHGMPNINIRIMQILSPCRGYYGEI